MGSVQVAPAPMCALSRVLCAWCARTPMFITRPECLLCLGARRAIRCACGVTVRRVAIRRELQCWLSCPARCPLLYVPVCVVCVWALGARCACGRGRPV